MKFWCWVCKKDIQTDINDHGERWEIQEGHLKEHQHRGDVVCWLCGGEGGPKHTGFCSGCGTSFGTHPCYACGR